jgi:hypothetical protein
MNIDGNNRWAQQRAPEDPIEEEDPERTITQVTAGQMHDV